jgi:tetratricopeptide (TPR) repeat protein
MLDAAGRSDEAIEQFRKTIELDPTVAMPHDNLAGVYEAKGLEKQAIEEYLKAGAVSGEDPAWIRELRHAYEVGGKRGFDRKRLAVALKAWDGWHWNAREIAGLYASVGQRKEAIDWLEKAYDARSGSLIWLGIQDWGSLRGEPRFEALLRRIGLPR